MRRHEFKVTSAGNELSCVLSDPPAPAEGALGVLVLVHSAPLGHRGSPPLAMLTELMPTPTLRFDLQGCGASAGEPRAAACARDAADVRAVVAHLRGVLQREVLGLVGFASGGTAALQYAATYRDVNFVATISARVESTAFSSVLTWAQLQELSRAGCLAIPHADGFGRSEQLVLTQADLDTRPELSGLSACASTDFLCLHGSQDTTVPLSDAHALEPLLCGARSHEVRVVPGVGHSWSGHESTLAYAIGEWLWRRAQQALLPESLAPDRQPSGFNIFVDSLAAHNKEIHAEARMQLPSMGFDGQSSSSDGEGEPTPLTSEQSRQCGRDRRPRGASGAGQHTSGAGGGYASSVSPAPGDELTQ